MRRAAHPYVRWEDYLAGMYGRVEGEIANDLARDAYELLTDPAAFTDAMGGMLHAWPTAAEHYLTRPGAKSRSWLGAAACMWRRGAPEHCTRAAWSTMTASQQVGANAAADEARGAWIARREDAVDA
jgi:hypothetical protein